jgi:hypothetical protein
MKRISAFAATLLLLATPASLRAQDGEPRQLVRADASGTVGWASANRSELTSYNGWRSQAAFSLAGGWYWTDHVVSRLEFSATTSDTVYTPEPFLLAGFQTVYIPTRRRFAAQRLGALQHYQFRRNEWVHPFVGAGLDVVWDHVSTEEEPVYAFDPVTRQSRLTRSAVAHGERTTVLARGVLTAGVKAYMARKAFGLTDLRVAIGRRRVEDVQWRFGIGVDF